MAQIEPFRGIRFNSEKVGDLNLVMAPPYDIIPPRLQEQLYQRHPNNIIRLELSRETTADTDRDNRYSRSAEDLRQWLKQGILIQEDRPVIYNYYMDYTTREGTHKTLKGFLSTVHLEEFNSGVVLPHENTLSGPKADRFKLMEACHANFSPIFSLYSNPGREIIRLLDDTSRDEPLIHVSDMDGVGHRIWAITETETIRKIQNILADLPLFIADGHHRYETALNYRNTMREKTGEKDGQQAFDYVMMYFSNMEDKGLTIYPTHRLVRHLQGFNLNRYLKEAEAYFDVRTFPFLKKKDFLRELISMGEHKTCFGLYSMENDDLFLLTLKDHEKIDPLFRKDLSPVLQTLDVTVLHTILLDHLLGIGEKELRAQTHVQYVKDTEDALHAVNDGDAQVAFLLNSTRMDQLRDVSLQKEKMPQKSTYFYPKLLTGLVLNSLK